MILPGHANKHRDSDGNLIFEGVGDIKSDSDDLIFFEKVKKPDGMDVIVGQAGKSRSRSVLVKRAVMQGDPQPFGTRFIYTAGDRNTHLYELPKEPPRQGAV